MAKFKHLGCQDHVPPWNLPALHKEVCQTYQAAGKPFLFSVWFDFCLIIDFSLINLKLKKSNGTKPVQLKKLIDMIIVIL